MKKRLLSALLALTVLLGSMPVYALEDTTPATPDPAGMSTAETASDAAANSQVENTELQMTEEVTVDTSDADLPDNDELFALYMQGQMYPGGMPSLMANWGQKENVLNENELALYNEIKSFVQQVAQGDVSSTKEVQLPFEHTWSGEELEITSWDETTIKEAVAKKLNINLSRVVDCLLVDCPADLYWFDKTTGISAGYSMSAKDNTVSIGVYVISMPVAKDYQVDGGDAYSVDTDKTGATKAVLANAQDIVSQYADDSTYAKLLAYKNEICKLTSYNTGAAENTSTPYGDPWQLIYVFDENPSTTVVCEGYAKAFQYLCDLSRIDCYTVTGTMAGGTGAGRHMWNIVPIDGQNYLVDVTNCDENTIGNPDNLFLVGTKGNVANGYTFTIGNSNITYKYDEKIIQLYGEDILTLANSNYDPTKPAEKLMISGMPETVTYGDTFTLTAAGTTDTVTWSTNGPVSVDDGNVTVTGVGDFTITASTDTQSASVTGKAVAKQLTVTGATAKNKPYDGTQNVTVTGVTLDGIVSGDDVSVEPSKITGTVSSANAGTYETISLQNLALTGDKANCYTLADTANDVQTTVTIEKATPTAPAGPFTATYGQKLGVIELQGGWSWAAPETVLNRLGDNKYEARYAQTTNYTEATATLTVTVTAQTVTPTVTMADEFSFTGSAIMPDVTVQVGDVTLTKDTDYTISYRDNTNVGTAKVTVHAVPDSGYAFEDVVKTFTIEKAEAPAATTKNVTYRYTETGEQQATVQNPMSANAGAVAYRAGTKTDEKNIISEWSVQENGTVKYMLSGDGAADDTATLSVIVSSQNYEDATVNLVISLTDREVPEVTVQPYSKTYNGLPVEIDAITKNSGSIDGIWSWKDSKAPVDVADSGTCYLLFTPNDTTNYAPVEVNVSVEITKAPSSVSQAPAAVSGLTYNGQPQTLVTEGTAQGGTMQYALAENGSYSEKLPTATDANTYTVWYKVAGDANHTDTQAKQLSVTIAKATPAATASHYTQKYSGNPVNIDDITKESGGIEGTWSWKDGTTAPIDVADSKTYQLVFTPDDTTNYTPVEVDVLVTITEAPSSVSQAPAAVPGLTYNTQSRTLVTAGTAQGGTMMYGLSEDGTYSENLPTATNAGDYTVWYKVAGDANHSDMEPVKLGTVTIAKATPNVTVSGYTREYSGQPVDINAITKDSGGIEGTWSWKDGKAPVNVADSKEYQLVFTPDDTTNYAPVEAGVLITINPAPSKLTKAPQVVTDLTYNGQPQALVTAGTAQGGTLQYALAENGSYSEELPTGTNAGTYTVWYKVVGDANHTDIAAAQLGTVTIAKAVPQAPQNLTTTYSHGAILSSVNLPDGWEWVNPNELLGDWGQKEFMAKHPGDGNYEPRKVAVKVYIKFADCSLGDVRVDDSMLTYNGTWQCLTGIQLSLEGYVLQQGIDYTVEDSGGIEAGSYVATLQGKGNYRGMIKYQYDILPKPVMAQVVAEDKVYDGTTDAVVSAVVETGVSGDSLTITGLKGIFAQADAGENLTVKVDSSQASWGNNNYEVTFPENATGSILPADYTYSGVADQAVKIGNGLDTVNQVAAADGVAGETVQGAVTWYQDEACTQPLPENYLFSGEEGDVVTLYWKFTPYSSQTNYTDVPKTGITNFKLTPKATPKVSAQSLTKTYDGKAVTLEDLKPTADVTGSWAMDVSTPELKNTGNYEVTLHFTPDNAREYETASITVTVKVEQRLLKVAVELSSDRITTQEALPTASLVWDNLLEGEEQLIPDTTPTFDGWPEDPMTAGNYSIRWANREEMMQALQANPLAVNYRLQIQETALLTVTETALLPGSDESYRLEAQEGLPVVPEAVQQAGFPTEEAVLDEMFRCAAQQLADATLENTVLHDVCLYYSPDGGKTWEEATQENFPDQGITVTLPYPDGTNAADFDFVVTHMITVAYNGYQPGDVETPAVTKTDKGIQFTVHSLSPIAISWKVAPKNIMSEEQTITREPISANSSGSISYYTCPACGYHDWTATDEGYRCDKCGYLESVKQLSGYGNVKGIYEPKSSGAAAASAQTIPQTGDESQPVLWAVLMFASALTLGGLLVSRRKRNR